MATKTESASEPTVVLHRSGEHNVSFIAGGVRVITRPGDQSAGTGRSLDAFAPGDSGYAQAVADEFAKHGVSVTAKDIEAALKE